MKLTDKAWACLKYELEDLAESSIDTALIEAIKLRVEADEEYCKDMNEIYSEVQDPRGLDTMDRDILYDFVAMELGFKHWPLYMDSEEYTNQFYKALEKRFV